MFYSTVLTRCCRSRTPRPVSSRPSPSACWSCTPDLHEVSSLLDVQHPDNCCGRQRKCWVDNVKEWTTPWPCQIANSGLPQERLEEDLCWIVPHVPQRPNRSRNWTEQLLKSYQDEAQFIFKGYHKDECGSLSWDTSLCVWRGFGKNEIEWNGRENVDKLNSVDDSGLSLEGTLTSVSAIPPLRIARNECEHLWPSGKG